MADVIHEHTTAAPAAESSDSGMGFLMGVILLVVVLFLLFYYGLPALRSGTSQMTTPQVNVPGKVDVNVNHK